MFEEGARDEDPTRDSTIAPLHSTISGTAPWRSGEGPHLPSSAWIVVLHSGVALECIAIQ